MISAQFLRFFHSVLFADDTNMIPCHNDLGKLMAEVDTELDKVVDCFNANELIINYDKNKCNILSY